MNKIKLKLHEKIFPLEVPFIEILNLTIGLSPKRISSSFVNLIETTRTFSRPKGRPCFDSPIPIIKERESERKRERERERERDGERERDKERDGERESESEIEIDRERERERDGER